MVSCYDNYQRDDGEWQGRFHAESCRVVQGSWKELRSTPERAMMNRRGAPHTARSSGAVIQFAQAGWHRGELPSQTMGQEGFLFPEKMPDAISLAQTGNKWAEYRVQSTDDLEDAFWIVPIGQTI